jgi:riboflavin kinase
LEEQEQDPQTNDKTQQRPLSHSIQLVTSDIVEFCESADSRAYDGVILNACFGNFYDPGALLKALPGGVIAISHPLGGAFVQQLHDQDPKMVPHVLPTSTLSMVQQWTFGIVPPLLPTYFKATPYYLMTLERGRRAKPLPLLHRYRGVVDQGYGRGGKKLGVPTANLPASLFQNALQEVDTGVYFGWAALEHIPNRVFKAVVNVGFSPTFEGKENKEKIIEAHLILTQKDNDNNDYAGDDDGDGGKEEETFAPLQDFYGQVMRLQLNGYLRDEEKFDSFPALVAQIHADIDDAREALDGSPFSDLRSDDFLKTAAANSCWVGTGGGDESASYEFVNHLETLTGMVDDYIQQGVANK